MLVSYPSGQAESAAISAAYPIIAYYAAGPGWLAFPIDLSEPVGQQSIVQDVALGLGDRILVGAKAPRASTSAG